MYDIDMKRTGRPASPSRSQFGAHVCALREAAGLTQQQVAEQLDISQPSYALWELRDVSLKPQQLSKLAQILGVRLDQLIEEQSPQPKRGGPTGRAKRLFESVSQLPRHQQQKIIEVLEAFVAQHSSERKPIY